MLYLPLEIINIIMEYNGPYPNIKINKIFTDVYYKVNKTKMNSLNIIHGDYNLLLNWLITPKTNTHYSYKFIKNSYIKGYAQVLISIIKIGNIFDDLFDIFLNYKSCDKKLENYVVRALFNDRKYMESNKYYNNKYACEIILRNGFVLDKKILYEAIKDENIYYVSLFLNKNKTYGIEKNLNNNEINKYLKIVQEHGNFDFDEYLYMFVKKSCSYYYPNVPNFNMNVFVSNITKVILINFDIKLLFKLAISVNIDKELLINYCKIPSDEFNKEFKRLLLKPYNKIYFCNLFLFCELGFITQMENLINLLLKYMTLDKARILFINNVNHDSKLYNYVKENVKLLLE